VIARLGAIRPERSERRAATAAMIALGATALAVLPFARIPLPPLVVLDGFVTGVIGTAFAIAATLFLRRTKGDGKGLSAMGVAFAVASCVAAAAAVTRAFGALLLPQIGGRPDASSWLYASWHAWVIAGVFAHRHGLRWPRPWLLVVVLGALNVALAVYGPMPPIAENFRWSSWFVFGLAPLLAVSALVAAKALRRFEDSLLDLWLRVLCVAVAADVVTAAAAVSRFTVGGYASRLIIFVVTVIMLVTLVSHVVRLYEAVGFQARQAEVDAHTDILTGIANRRALQAHAKAALERAGPQATPLSVVMIDVDLFKKFNDSFGHAQGDACLRRIGQILAAEFSRSGDFVARYGGEEFAALLEETDAAQAMIATDRARAALVALQVRHPHSSHGYVSFSAGVAEFRPGETFDTLLARADAALYLAKVRGRNRIELASAASGDHKPAGARDVERTV
jgi:diguanylate cyclase (GGDEF)-like protein